MGEPGLVAGMATAVGSLPHRNAHAAASLVLRCLPDLPAAPQLPQRSPFESMIAQAASALPDVVVQPNGSLARDIRLGADATIAPEFTPDAFGGLLTFLEVATEKALPVRRIKVQVAGPLTLGLALVVDAGVPTDIAFPLAARVARAWSVAFEELIGRALPGVRLVMFFDEPALVCWRGAEGPIDREVAIDLLSSALAATRAITGVHVCGAGDLRLALAAGPNVVHCDVSALDLDDAVAISRFLEGDGWLAWGAIPTHRPVGEHAQPLWKALLDTWCELTRRGCDPARLRTQALVAPACGLAGHGESQGERAMLLARQIGGHVHDHAAACRLAVGA